MTSSRGCKQTPTVALPSPKLSFNVRSLKSGRQPPERCAGPAVWSHRLSLVCHTVQTPQHSHQKDGNTLTVAQFVMYATFLVSWAEVHARWSSTAAALTSRARDRAMVAVEARLKAASD